MTTVAQEIHTAVTSLKSADEVEPLRVLIETLSTLATADPNVDLIIVEGAVPSLVRCLGMPLLEEQAAYLVGLMANKPANQMILYDAEPLPILVEILLRNKDDGCTKKVVYAIKRIIHQMPVYKRSVGLLGGIRALLLILKPEDLESMDNELVQDVAGVLCSLVRNENANKIEILNCDAFPTLILMLQSENLTFSHEAVRVIDAITQSSTNDIIRSLFSRVLQPVIDLLRCTSTSTQKLAALLIARYASADSNAKAYIVQRGAVGPLVEMIKSANIKLKEAALFALGRLANDLNCHNQVAISQAGGIPALLTALDEENTSLQHNAAFALKGIAISEDVVLNFIRAGGVKKLLEREYDYEPTRRCVEETLRRLEAHIQTKRVMLRLLAVMHTSDNISKSMIVLALARMCSSKDMKQIFLENHGIEILVDLLKSGDSHVRSFACSALYSLKEKARQSNPHFAVFSPRLFDEFGMPRCQDITVDNLSSTYEMAKGLMDTKLMKKGLMDTKLMDDCALFALKEFKQLDAKPWYHTLLMKMRGHITYMMAGYINQSV